MPGMVGRRKRVYWGWLYILLWILGRIVNSFRDEQLFRNLFSHIVSRVNLLELERVRYVDSQTLFGRLPPSVGSYIHRVLARISRYFSSRMAQAQDMLIRRLQTLVLAMVTCGGFESSE